jgi:hypothetical protein
MWQYGFISVIFLSCVFLFAGLASAADGIPTKVLVRVVSKDAKVIGSGVGGASVRIVNAETGQTLAAGRQEGGTGDTDRIMTDPRQRGKSVYDTIGAAFFLAEISLDRPTRVEIQVEAPLAYPQAMQRGVKTVTLIPGKHITGEGIVIELDGLIVNMLEPASGAALKKGATVSVRAEVRML